LRKLILIARLFLFSLPFQAFAQPPQRLSIEEAIAIAVTAQPEVLAAQKEIEAAEGRTLQAGRIANPEISAVYNEMPTGLSFGEAGEQDISLSQIIEFPGKRGARIEFAEHGKSIAELSLWRTRSLVTVKVKRTYYQALLAAEVVKNLDFTISLVSDFLKVVTDRYQAGSSSYIDLIRAKVELSRLRNEAIEARRDAVSRLSELNLLLGRSDETPIVLTDSLVSEPLGLSRDSALTYYVNASSFLQIVQLDVRRSGSLLSVAQTNYLPDFGVSLSLQRRRGQLSPTGTDRYLGLALGVSVPLWFWQAPKGEVQEAEALLDIATIRVEAARRLVLQKIRSSYGVASVAEQQVKAFETSLIRDTEDELRSGIAAYQNNQIDALNLFDIYRTYRATKIEYARALYNYLAAKAELEAAGEIPE